MSKGLWDEGKLRPTLLVDTAKNLLSAIRPLREWVERLSNRRAAEALDSSRPFALWKELQDRTGGSLTICDKEVVEIGPGRSLGLSLIFLAAGARRVHAVDRFRHLFWDDTDRQHIAHVLDRLDAEEWPKAASARRAIQGLDAGPVTLDTELLVYSQTDGANLPLPAGTVDLSYSNAVLEHVHEPARVVRELARVTKQGGDSIHEIDFRDHFVEDDRLRLLEFNEWEWQLRTRLRPGYTNRWRLSEFKNEFGSAGFSIHDSKVTNAIDPEDVDELRPRWVPRFRNRPTDELRVLSFWGWWRRS